MANGTTDVPSGSPAQVSPVVIDLNRQVELRDIYPEVAILLGYMMYLADAAEGYMKQYALSTVESILLPLKSFDPTTPLGIYASKIQAAAIGLARGISSRKRILNVKLTDAEDKRRDGIARFAKTLKCWGWLTAAVRLVLLGGFGYAFVMAVFGMSAIQNRATGVSAQFASIATALAFALVGSYISASINTLRVVNIFKEHDAAISRADAEYSSRVESEYRYAAEAANLAWQALTGRTDAPMSPGFHNILFDVVTGRQGTSGVREQKPSVTLLTKLRCLASGDIDRLMGRNPKSQVEAVSKKT